MVKKYIDAERLTVEIERLKDEYTDIAIDSQRGWVNANSVIDDLEQLQSHILTLQQEQLEVDLDAIVNEAFDRYSSVDGYGQLSVSFNRAELYSFVKKIAREIYKRENK